MMGVWERTVVIVSKDDNLTKSHVRYLESRLIKMAQCARRANLTNDTAPEPASLPQPAVADMEFFLDRARALAWELPSSRRSSSCARWTPWRRRRRSTVIGQPSMRFMRAAAEADPTAVRR